MAARDSTCGKEHEVGVQAEQEGVRELARCTQDRVLDCVPLLNQSNCVVGVGCGHNKHNTPLMLGGINYGRAPGVSGTRTHAKEQWA
jgi:hypothetical protein